MSAAGAAQGSAAQLYDGGADVVFQVTGASAVGVFTAAKEHGKLAIGAYTDQYQSAGPQLQSVILTSLLKLLDRQVAAVITGLAAGRFTAGVQRGDLRDGGVQWSSSGELIDPIEARLNADKQKIINGQIVVPSGR
jgi:basic membrane protein A